MLARLKRPGGEPAQEGACGLGVYELSRQHGIEHEKQSEAQPGKAVKLHAPVLRAGLHERKYAAERKRQKDRRGEVVILKGDA